MKREVAEESDKSETDCKIDGCGAEPRPNRVLVAICGLCSSHAKTVVVVATGEGVPRTRSHIPSGMVSVASNISSRTCA